MIRKFFMYVPVLLPVFLGACVESADPRLEEASFTRIYDNNQFNLSLSPIDIRQTDDKGYLILSDRKLTETELGSVGLENAPAGIYIMKVDEKGNFVADLEVDASYVHPVGRLMEKQGSYYFFCMDKESVGVLLAKFDANAESIEFIPIGGHNYPMAADIDPQTTNFLLLSYNDVDRESVLSIISPTGAVGNSVGIKVGSGDDEAIDLLIQNHFIRTRRHYPFQVGRVLPSGPCYFTGFEEYTFSLVFTTFDNDDPIVGAINGQQENGGVSAVTSLSGGRFAVSWFNFSENYLLPGTTLSTTDPSVQVVQLGGYSLPEMTPYAKVKIKQALIKDEKTLIFGSDTRAKQIGLYFYDETAGEFKGTKYLGFSNPFEIASMEQTSDDGLIVCGTTYIAGRFPRICLFKLSKEELEQCID